MKKYKDGCDNVPFLKNLCNRLLAPDVAQKKSIYF